jgi:hypothetical protein
VAARTRGRGKTGAARKPEPAPGRPDSKPKRGRGRPRIATFAPVPKDEEAQVADLLASEEGITQLEDALYVRIRKGGTALEQDAQARELRFLRDRRANLRGHTQLETDARLAAALEEMNRRQRAKAGSALRSDMAPAPPPAPGEGTLQ